MKHLKLLSFLSALALLFASCVDETSNLQNAEEQKAASFKTSEITTGNLYALYPWSSTDNIALYNYNPITDDIFLDESYLGSLNADDNNQGFDYNKEDGLVYFIAGFGDDKPEVLTKEGYSASRYLYSYNINTETTLLIDRLESQEGTSKAQDLTFGNDGTLYIVFQGGEINTFNFNTNTCSSYTYVDSYGAVGLTYNFDSNQLIYVTSNDPVEVYSVAIPSGNVEEMFAFYAPLGYDSDDEDSDSCTAQGIEYVGNNKAIVSSTYGCDIIYTLDLVTESTNLLLNPTGFEDSIKDLMFIHTDDFDNDGCINEEDAYPNSNMRSTLKIGPNYYYSIDNVKVDCGTFMQDQIDNLVNQINDGYNGNAAKSQGGEDNWEELHDAFTTKLAHITYYWRINKLITAGERAEISSDAWSADIPNREE